MSRLAKDGMADFEANFKTVSRRKKIQEKRHIPLDLSLYDGMHNSNGKHARWPVAAPQLGEPSLRVT